MSCLCWMKCWLQCLPLDGAPSFLEIRQGVHQFLFTLAFANSMLIFHTFVNINVILRYIWNLKYSFRHSWIKLYVCFLLDLNGYDPQLFGLASWRKIECQFWAFNTQWDFGSKSLECAKLNILIKYVNNTCWNYFLVTLEMLGYHWKFFGGSRMARKARKRDKCEKTWIL